MPYTHRMGRMLCCYCCCSVVVAVVVAAVAAAAATAAVWHNDSFQSVRFAVREKVRNYKIALNLVLVGNLNRHRAHRRSRSLVLLSSSSSSSCLRCSRRAQYNCCVFSGQTIIA